MRSSFGSNRHRTCKPDPASVLVDVQYEKKQVVVTFDEAKKNIDALVKATTNAGYPSQPEKDAR